jgi:hypothetical protein
LNYELAHVKQQRIPSLSTDAQSFVHRGLMIHGIVLVCIVPSTVALSPHCPTVPLSQYALLQCPTVPFSLSHGPIVRVSIVPASMVPLSIVSQPYCPIAHFSHCPASQCPLPHCLLSGVLFGLGWNESMSKGNSQWVVFWGYWKHLA